MELGPGLLVAPMLLHAAWTPQNGGRASFFQSAAGTVFPDPLSWCATGLLDLTQAGRCVGSEDIRHGSQSLMLRLVVGTLQGPHRYVGASPPTLS